MPPQAIALLASLSYALVLITSRRGMQYSTPTTVTLVSLIVHTVTLWAAVFLTRGIPDVSATAVCVFVVAGALQPVIRLCTYTGVQKVGASRSAPIRSSHPMFGVLIAVTVLHEVATVLALAGALLVVCGIVMITWERTGNSPQVRWWYFLIPLTAALLAGIVHPMRRYALSLSNEPLFFAALVGVVSLVCFLLYLLMTRNALVWHRKAIGPFLAAGLFETLGILLVIYALAAGTVVVVSPLVGISPLWALLGAVIFLRDLERINRRTVIGTVCVVVGTAAISLGG